MNLKIIPRIICEAITLNFKLSSEAVASLAWPWRLSAFIKRSVLFSAVLVPSTTVCVLDSLAICGSCMGLSCFFYFCCYCCRFSSLFIYFPFLFAKMSSLEAKKRYVATADVFLVFFFLVIVSLKINGLIVRNVWRDDTHTLKKIYLLRIATGFFNYLHLSIFLNSNHQIMARSLQRANP